MRQIGQEVHKQTNRDYYFIYIDYIDFNVFSKFIPRYCVAKLAESLTVSAEPAIKMRTHNDLIKKKEFTMIIKSEAIAV